jgi:hypothetical protein
MFTAMESRWPSRKSLAQRSFGKRLWHNLCQPTLLLMSKQEILQNARKTKLGDFYRNEKLQHQILFQQFDAVPSHSDICIQSFAPEATYAALSLVNQPKNLRNPRPRNLAWRYVSGKNFWLYLSNVYEKVVFLLQPPFGLPMQRRVRAYSKAAFQETVSCHLPPQPLQSSIRFPVSKGAIACH